MTTENLIMPASPPATVAGWLESLPEPYKAKALANLNPDVSGEESPSMSDSLSEAFPWADAAEGFQFWDMIARHYDTEGQVDLPDPDLLPALNAMTDNASWRMSRVRSLARAISSETEVIRIKAWVREMVGLI